MTSNGRPADHMTIRLVLITVVVPLTVLNGRLYGRPYALDKAREAFDDAGTAVAIEELAELAPPKQPNVGENS